LKVRREAGEDDGRLLRLRGTLGADALASAWADGRHMSEEDTVAFALAD
jgi:hypothetical protein